ncbi:MAG: hypothetical protein LR015_13795 [Verrucomicrobia bacterium]|nr:hypothetical protein [Verrucomicrobiota bacterium]
MPQLRKSVSLNGFWQFQFLGKADPDSVAINQLQCQQRTLVPSAFDALPDALAGKRGVAAYQTSFHVPAGQAARLRFGAVSMWSAVYVDGTLLTEHHNGYAPFDVEVPISPAEERSLIVLVDNRYNFERTPMHEEFFDFYQYGGILREVKVEYLPTSSYYMDYVHFLPTANYHSGEVEVRMVWRVLICRI